MTAIVQASVDAGTEARAAEVLDRLGLTVSDALRILLTRIANDDRLPADFIEDPSAYDAWFRAKVQEALDDPRPTVHHDEVSAHFARRRADASAKL